MSYERQHETGLFLPTELAKEREVWTNEEWKHLRRTSKVAEERNIRAAFSCKNCEKWIRFDDGVDGMEMVCDCKRRVLLG